MTISSLAGKSEPKAVLVDLGRLEREYFGYTEERTSSTPFDMRVMNDLDRFHLVADVINRVPRLGARAAYAKRAIRDKLIEHKESIARCADDMPDVKGWTWGQASTVQRASSTEADNG